jgi:hypothetical protein
MKRTTLNIRSVKSYTAPSNPSTSDPPVAAAHIQVTTAPVTTAPIPIPVTATPAAPIPVTAAPIPVTATTAPVIATAPVVTAAPVATTPPPVAAVPVAAVPVPVTVVHGTEWFVDPGITMNHLNNHYCAPKPWQMKDAVGEYHSAGSNKSSGLSQLDYFLLLFPPKQLVTMLELTNESLVMNRKKAMTAGELLAFFGGVILATQHEFTS